MGTGTISRRLSCRLPSDFLLQLDREATGQSVLLHLTLVQGSKVRASPIQVAVKNLQSLLHTWACGVN